MAEGQRKIADNHKEYGEKQIEIEQGDCQGWSPRLPVPSSGFRQFHRSEQRDKCKGLFEAPCREAAGCSPATPLQALLLITPPPPARRLLALGVYGEGGAAITRSSFSVSGLPQDDESAAGSRGISPPECGGCEGSGRTHGSGRMQLAGDRENQRRLCRGRLQREDPAALA